MFDCVVVGQHAHDRRGLGHPVAVEDPRGGERVLQCLDQRRGDRRAAVADPPHGRHVRRRELGAAQDQGVDRGDGHEVGDPLARDRRDHLRLVERRQDDRCAADAGGDEQLRVTAGDVEQRHRDQRPQAGADIGRKAEAGKHVLGIGQKRLVGRRHALGIAGGAGCVEERRDVAEAKSVDDQRVPVRQGTVCGEVHRDPGVLQHELDLGLGRARVDRDSHAPGHERAPEREHPVHPGRIAHGDPVAARHPGRAQAPRDSRGTVPQLPIGQPLAADLDHGLHVRAGLHMAREHRDQ